MCENTFFDQATLEAIALFPISDLDLIPQVKKLNSDKLVSSGIMQPSMVDMFDKLFLDLDEKGTIHFFDNDSLLAVQADSSVKLSVNAQSPPNSGYISAHGARDKWTAQLTATVLGPKTQRGVLYMLV